MADDLVERLEAYVCVGGYECLCQACALLADAIAEIERLRAEVSTLMHGMEMAWGLIANGQYWDATDPVRHAEWEQAKFKWRDEHWHPALDRDKEARRG